jgi:hypothetical protein
MEKIETSQPTYGAVQSSKSISKSTSCGNQGSIQNDQHMQNCMGILISTRLQSVYQAQKQSFLSQSVSSRCPLPITVNKAGTLIHA